MSPRYATQLPAGVVTYGPRISVSAAALGEPLLSWQQHAADLIGAVDPIDSTRWLYSLIVITVPRQSGKSTLLRAVHTDRLIRPLPDLPAITKPITLWTTAQTGKDARRRFSQLADSIGASPALGRMVHRRASVGSERLTLGLVSLAPFAPTPKALHGETTPMVSIDEAWAFDEAAAASLLAAITPTMQNFTGSQLIVVSTAGTEMSRWLWSLVKAGRAATSDPTSRIAYIEYSADPAYSDTGKADPLDPAALAFHPGIRDGLTTVSEITELYPQAGGIDNIRRGFLNLWPSTMDVTASRDMAKYDAAAEPDYIPTGPPTAYAADVATNRSGSALYAAWRTPYGTHVALVRSEPGTLWLPSEIKDRNCYPLTADPTGYTGAALNDLTPPATPATSRDLADATASWIADLADGSLTHDGTPELRAAYETAPLTNAAGAGITFDPRAAQIDHLRAAMLAAHQAKRHHIPTISW